jgi:hypothetical protein
MLKVAVVAVCLALLPSSVAVDRNNFKTCDQSSFCKRNRELEVSLTGLVIVVCGGLSDVVAVVPPFEESAIPRSILRQA